MRAKASPLFSACQIISGDCDAEDPPLLIKSNTVTNPNQMGLKRNGFVVFMRLDLLTLSFNKHLNLGTSPLDLYG
jgi:hypothetical protein